MTAKQLTTYVVLSVEPVLVDSRPSSKKRGLDRKMRVAECVVARERDFGVNDTQFTCLTHLGNILREGDFVQGLVARVVFDLNIRNLHMYFYNVHMLTLCHIH